MQLASRASLWIELAFAVAALGAATLVHPVHHARRHDHCGHRVALTHIVPAVELRPAAATPPAALPPPDCDVVMPANVELAYREARFADAEQLAGRVAGCERTAELLELLDHQWTTGMAHELGGADAATRLTELQHARSTDLSLGGAHTDQLDLAIAQLASRAAELYLARAAATRDREVSCADVAAAARALDDAALLGVRDDDRANGVVRERAALHCAALPSLAVEWSRPPLDGDR